MYSGWPSHYNVGCLARLKTTFEFNLVTKGKQTTLPFPSQGQEIFDGLSWAAQFINFLTDPGHVHYGCAIIKTCSTYNIDHVNIGQYYMFSTLGFYSYIKCACFSFCPPTVCIFRVFNAWALTWYSTVCWYRHLYKDMNGKTYSL